MKIRIDGDNIRLRLDRSEVEKIGAGNAVELATRFSCGNAFGYHLAVAAGTKAVVADFANGRISVTLPKEQALYWAKTETEVGISAQQSLGGGDHLQLLIEKDFECLDPREGEDQTNRFINPKAATDSE